MRAYYEQGKERDRLAGAKGVLEFERTKEILQRRMGLLHERVTGWVTQPEWLARS
jgi:hypothetical protein